MDININQIRSTLYDIGGNIFNWHTVTVFFFIFFIVLVVNRTISWLGSELVKSFVYYIEKVEGNRSISFKRAETWLNVVLSVIKIFNIALALYIGWRVAYPSSAPAAAVGAGALFIVLAGGTIGPLLRDITAGSIMIAERWYGVGDYITVEPFLNVAGVVERVTLRSTKLRTLSGEAVWMHNQHIQAVKVKYRGTTTVSLDVFVKDKQKAINLLDGIINIVPKGPMLVMDGLSITDTEQLHDNMWRIELSGKTVPGREWLVEKFALEAITHADENHPNKEKIIVYGPIARYVDSVAEKRFKRAVK